MATSKIINKTPSKILMDVKYISFQKEISNKVVVYKFESQEQ